MKSFREHVEIDESVATMVAEYMPQIMTILNAVKPSLHKDQTQAVKDDVLAWIQKIRKPSKSQVVTKTKEIVNKLLKKESTELEEDSREPIPRGKLTLKKVDRGRGDWYQFYVGNKPLFAAGADSPRNAVANLEMQYKTDGMDLKPFWRNVESTELEEAKTIKVGEDAIGADHTTYAIVKERMIMAIGEKDEMLELSSGTGGRVWLVNANRRIGNILENVQ